MPTVWRRLTGCGTLYLCDEGTSAHRQRRNGSWGRPYPPDRRTRQLPLAQAGAGNQPATRLPPTPAPTTNTAEMTLRIRVMSVFVRGIPTSLRFEASASPAN